MRVIQAMGFPGHHIHTVVSYQWRLDVSFYPILAAAPCQSFFTLHYLCSSSSGGVLSLHIGNFDTLGIEVHCTSIEEANTHTHTNWVMFVHT